jgi:hypothetical protein
VDKKSLKALKKGILNIEFSSVDPQQGFENVSTKIILYKTNVHSLEDMFFQFLRNSTNFFESSEVRGSNVVECNRSL